MNEWITIIQEGDTEPIYWKARIYNANLITPEYWLRLFS